MAGGGGGFRCFFRDSHRTQGGAQLVGDQREQGERFAIGASGAAQDFAVCGESLDLRWILLEDPSGEDGLNKLFFACPHEMKIHSESKGHPMVGLPEE